MKRNKKSGFGIVGLGRFGLALANMLAEAGKEVMVIDEDETNIRKVRNVVQEAYLVGRLTPEALEETGIGECNTVIVCIGKVDVSVLTTQTILDLGVPRVISKADSKEHGMILEKIGADIVYPERETAVRLAGVLLGSQAIDLMRLNDNYVISEIKIPKHMDGCTVESLKAEKYNVKLIVVELEPNITMSTFPKTQKLYTADAIVVLGKFVDVERFENSVINKE